jgi:aryl-alcohol dehydrogenase-like predicted oxidoreductase
MEETLDALDTLVHQGKVRYIGVSNHSAWHVMKSLGISERLGLQRYVTQQIYYSLLDRDAEYELVPLSIEEKVGILVWSPLAGGILSGKMRRGVEPPEGSRMATEWGEPPVYNRERMFDIIDALISVADARGVSAAQVALAYLLGKPAVSAVIFGARNEEQLVDNLAAVDLHLSADERGKLDTVSAMPLIYPYWHQANSASERLSAADESLLAPHHL